MAEAKVTKDMGILDAVQQYPETATVLQAIGMHCFGCMAARFENLEQGCLAHGVDPDMVCEKINEMIAESAK